MTAEDVKAALRRRHPAEPKGSMVGEWVCLEEWASVDLIALSAWRSSKVIGYEVKVTRSDLRNELLAPSKRAMAVERCTEFYFAVPHGLLRPEEIAFEEPEWSPGDFERTPCPGVAAGGPPSSRYRRAADRPPRYGGLCKGRGTAKFKAGRRRAGPFTVELPVPLASVDEPQDYHTHKWADGERVPLEGDELADALAAWHWHRIWEAEAGTRCPTCGGKGYIARSRVEDQAPTLWIPRDVGLIEITGRGCRVTKQSPRRPHAHGLIPGADRQAVAQLVRWASFRPDPRHLAHRLVA